jgi:hypothetical protein
VVINDPQLNSSGKLVSGTGTNPRDRDSVDFYRITTNSSTSPATVSGSTVVHSPGWGFTNHSSYVNFTNDVAYDVNGASFVGEAGDEIGSFNTDMAIHSAGTSDNNFYDAARVAVQDWAHEGDGFWGQGNGISMLNNIAIGQASSGYYYMYKPYTSPVQNVKPSSLAINFHNNLAESDDYALFPRYETGGGVFDGLTAHNCITGYKQQYCSDPSGATGITLQNSFLYGTPFSDYGITLPVESAVNFVALNDTVIGYPTGMGVSEQDDQTITGGTWNNTVNIQIPTSVDSTGRTITISNPTFVTSSNPNHYDIYFMNTFGDVFTRNINAFFMPNQVLYNGDQLYAPWQALDYVPFPTQPNPPGAPALPAALIGLTNQQLVSQFGLAMGGALSGQSLAIAAVTNATVGPVATYPPMLYYANPWSTNQLTGYVVQYTLTKGGTVYTVGTYNLSLWWNMFTFTDANGILRTEFVLGTK